MQPNLVDGRPSKASVSAVFTVKVMVNIENVICLPRQYIFSITQPFVTQLAMVIHQRRLEHHAEQLGCCLGSFYFPLHNVGYCKRWSKEITISGVSLLSADKHWGA